MKKSDLKVGYVVKNRNEDLYMVMQSELCDGLVISRFGGWDKISSFNDDLTAKGSFPGVKNYDIMKVYGFSSFPTEATIISTDNRKLLWKREEPKKMTVAEIENILGYKIEVVSES